MTEQTPTPAHNGSPASSSSALPPLPVVPADPVHLRSLLQSFLSLQTARQQTYSAFKQGFQRFMAEREEWEEEQQKESEQRAAKSTRLVRGQKGAEELSDAERLEQLQEEAEERQQQEQDPSLTPEQSFQLLCTEVMQHFQSVSSEIRGIIARLKARSVSSSSSRSSSSSSSAIHFSSLLSSLQQLEKSKFELTIHQQMLLNQRYVLAHPQQHGQLQEHKHHVHTVTDSKGRVRQHPRHKGAGACTHGLEAVGEEQAEGEEEGHSEHEEGEENLPAHLPHLSALLSDTAFATRSPFLFPPSGAAPAALDRDDSISPSSSSPSPTPLSEEQREQFDSQLRDLRLQEQEVVLQINEVLEEVREFTMDEDSEEEEEEAEGEDGARTGTAAAASTPSPSPPPVRPAQLGDAAALAAVQLQAWKGAYAHMLPSDYVNSLTEAPFREKWESKLAKQQQTHSTSDSASPPTSGKRTLVSVDPSTSSVCGYISVEVRADPADATPPVSGEVTALNLAPAAWGRGIGAALMSAALSELSRLGCRSAFLWVVEQNVRARRFYEKQGFQPDGASQTNTERPHPLKEVRYVRDISQAGSTPLSAAKDGSSA